MTVYLHKHFSRLLSTALLAATALCVEARADVLQIGAAGEADWIARNVPAAAAGVAAPAGRTAPTTLAPYFDSAADRTNVSPQLLEAVAATESAFRPGAVSAKGARGVMQLMPATARMMGVTDPDDPRQNIHGGAAYLSDLLKTFDGDTVLALAAYNAGPGAVRRHGGVPPFPETRAYVARVLDALAAAAERQP